MTNEEKNIIAEIDAMCVEYEFSGKNATQAISDNDESAMWDVAEFYGLDDSGVIGITFDMLKRIANE